jgi:hypothetical protein
LFHAGIGIVPNNISSQRVSAQCENITWSSGTVESYGPVSYTPSVTSYVFPGEASARPASATEHDSAVYRYEATGGSASATITYAIQGSISYQNI